MLDHQDRPPQIEPDRSQSTSGFVVPAHLAQAEQITVKSRDAFDVAGAERKVVQFPRRGILRSVGGSEEPRSGLEFRDGYD